MAIHNEQHREMGSGHVKKIDAAGMDFMFRMAQEQQYQFPVKSTVRELLSNAVDAVADRKVAVEILTGKAKVEDYFEEREGDIYKDSKWDPSYYDLKWLSNVEDVEMHYVIGQGTNKDRVDVIDYGIGLGGKRLENYFNLAYSTKRLSKLPIGKFGVGGKVALSTGVDYYTTESRYNGRLYRFNIYSRTFDSIVPRFNLETGKENGYVVFSEGEPDEYKVYYEETIEKNGVTVSFEVKKHHKQHYIDAVKSQLLYFTNINLYLVHEDGHKELVPTKANIIYEDEHIILSDNQYYSKPHILLNKVTYGYIQFDELELEEKVGNIGIKVAPESVEVNTSRESLVWKERTKETILSKFGTVVDIATRFINDTLKENDFWRWIKKCYSISARYSEQGGIIGRLAKIVDLTQVNPVFPGDNRIKFKQDISEILDFDTIFVSYVTINKKNVQQKVVDRKGTKNLGGYINAKLIIRNADERASNRKDKYLLSLYPEGFLMMTEPVVHAWMLDQSKYSDETHDIFTERIAERKKKGYASLYDIWEMVLASKDPIHYDSVEVPKDFSGTEEEEEIKDEEETVEDVKEAKIAKQTAEERRKLEGKIIVNTPRATEVNFMNAHGAWHGSRTLAGSGMDITKWTVAADAKAYEWQKIEVPIKDINDWDAEEIYYCKEDDSEMAHFVAMLTRDVHPDNRIGYGTRRNYAKDGPEWMGSKWWRLHNDGTTNTGKQHSSYIDSVPYSYAFNCQHYFDAQIMIVKASQANLKYLRDFRPIQEFFIKIKNNKITMSNTLVKWNTARKIKDELAKAAFLYNFEQFNQKYADLYKALTDYVDKNYREVAEQQNNGFYGLKSETYSDLLNHLDAVSRFQEYVANNSEDKEGIAILAQGLFGNKELQDGMAVDPEMIDNLQQVLDFASGCGTMLNYIPKLTGYSISAVNELISYFPGASRQKTTVPEYLELEIKQYLEYKGMLNYGTVLQEDVDQDPFADTGKSVQEDEVRSGGVLEEVQ